MAEKKKANSKKRDVKAKPAPSGKPKSVTKAKLNAKMVSKPKAGSKVRVSEPVARVVNKISPPRTQNGDDRKSSRVRVTHQYNYMKAPGLMYDFQVGDRVEVFCDHEKGRERVRGWIAGIVVQVDNKMVAVQFRSNVYLTDGWMVPDRILWYPLASEHIRPEAGKKSVKKEKAIPVY